MAALTGNSVASSYQGLLKFDDNGTVQPTTLKALSDGTGGSLPISLSQVETKFTPGTIVDLTGVTVNGLPGGAPGLVNGNGTGTGLKAIKSADSLTTTPSVTTSGGDIALGENARTTGADNFGRSNIAIGTDSLASNERGVAIGYRAESNGSRSVAIGEQAIASAARSTAIGQRTSATGFRSINIGDYGSAQQSGSISIGGAAQSRAENCITIGTNAIVDDSIRVDTVVIGANSKAAQYSIALGAGAFAVGAYSIALGDANVSNNYAIAIGDGAASSLASAVALGEGVTAVYADGTTVQNFAIANYASLNFADDTAAATGGVPLGGVYHNAGALRIRIA